MKAAVARLRSAFEFGGHDFDASTLTASLYLGALVSILLPFASYYSQQEQPNRMFAYSFALFCISLILVQLKRAAKEALRGSFLGPILTIALTLLFFLLRYPTAHYPFKLGDFGDYSTSAFSLANSGEIPTSWYHGSVFWMNAGIQIFGKDWAHLITLVFGFISIIFVSRCAYLYSGKSEIVFYASFALLTCMLPHIWYSQLPAAEISAQAFFFSGVYYLLRSSAHPQSLVFPVVSAAAFACYFLTRPMGLLIYHLLWIYVLIALLLDDEGVKRWQVHFLTGLTLGFAGWSLYTYRFNVGYLDYQLSFQAPGSGIDSATVMWGSALLTACYVLVAVGLSRRSKLVGKVSRWAIRLFNRGITRALGFFIGFSLAYLYFGASSGLGEKLLRVASFTAYLGGALFIFGLYRWFNSNRDVWQGLHLFLFVPILFAFYLNRYPVTDGLHFLYWDRYFFEICFGYFVLLVVLGLPKARRLTLFIVGLICVYGIYDSQLILGKAELQGAYDSLTRLDSLVPDNASLVFGIDGRLNDEDWIATSERHAPLTLPVAFHRICNKNVLDTDMIRVSSREDLSRLWGYLGEQERLYFIYISRKAPSFESIPGSIKVQRVGEVQFQYSHFYRIEQEPGRGLRRDFDIPVYVYEVDKSGRELE